MASRTAEGKHTTRFIIEVKTETKASGYVPAMTV